MDPEPCRRHIVDETTSAALAARMDRDPMNTPVHAVRWAAIGIHKAQAHRTAGGVRDPEEIASASLRWREVHQFPFPRTSSPAATVDHSKTMRVLNMLQEELVQLDPGQSDALPHWA